ncbi:hypothetical protein MMC14_006228 [Varicellaria rhodocarpa]|nr:hypothetical protein [Varicellaria rhodocarpa]
MIALISGAVLALFIAGVDARAIRFKTIEVHHNDGIFPSSVQTQNPGQGTGTANPIVFSTGTESRPEPSPEDHQKRDASSVFKTLTVGVFDGVFPSSQTQHPGTGLMMGPSYPTGHVFPAATGPQLESSANPVSMPLPSSVAPPGFFVSLPFYTITVTQTVTYAAMTKTSQLLPLTTISTSIPDGGSGPTMITTPAASPVETSGFLGGIGTNHESVLGAPPNSQVLSEAPNVATPSMQTFGPGMESALGIAPVNVAPTEIPTSILPSIQTLAPSNNGPSAMPPPPQSSGFLSPSLAPYSNSTANPPLAQSTSMDGNPMTSSVLSLPTETPIVTTIDTAIASTIISNYIIPISTITIGEAPVAATPAGTIPAVASPGTNLPESAPGQGSQPVFTQPEITQPETTIVEPGTFQPDISQRPNTQSPAIQAVNQIDVITSEPIYHGQPQTSQSEVVPPEYAHRAYAHVKAAGPVITHPKNSLDNTYAETAHARMAQSGASGPRLAHAEIAHMAATHPRYPQGGVTHARVAPGGLVWYV